MPGVWRAPVALNQLDLRTRSLRVSRSIQSWYRNTCLLLVVSVCFLAGCKRSSFRVAVIPRTTAETIWEAVHAGAEFAAGPQNIEVYWNAPTSADDFQQQAALIDRVVAEHYQGLIVAPDQPLVLMTPVQRAVQEGVRTVVIASPLTIPAQPNLAYIVNDDEASGRMAGMRVGQILEGHGKVAVLGIDPESLSDLTVLHSFEKNLEVHFPNISVEDLRPGTHNGVEARQIADEVLTSHHDLDAILTLSSIATYGTIDALQSRGLTGRIKLVGFEQSVEIGNQVRAGIVDSLIAKDTYQMGYRALTLLAEQRNKPLPALEIKLEPILLTRENIDSPQGQRLINQDWRRRP
jgi:ribose transport system substrate-binding protein